MPVVQHFVNTNVYRDYVRTTRRRSPPTGDTMPEALPPHQGPAITIEPGRTYRLRDMRSKLYCVGAMENGTDMVCTVNGNYKTYWRNGKLSGAGSAKRPDDAVLEWRELIRVQIYGYQNVYADHTRSEIFETRDLANSNVDASKTRIACINMEREVVEGEGLYD